MGARLNERERSVVPELFVPAAVIQIGLLCWMLRLSRETLKLNFRGLAKCLDYPSRLFRLFRPFRPATAKCQINKSTSTERLIELPRWGSVEGDD